MLVRDPGFPGRRFLARFPPSITTYVYVWMCRVNRSIGCRRGRGTLYTSSDNTQPCDGSRRGVMGLAVLNHIKSNHRRGEGWSIRIIIRKTDRSLSGLLSCSRRCRIVYQWYCGDSHPTIRRRQTPFILSFLVHERNAGTAVETDT